MSLENEVKKESSILASDITVRSFRVCGGGLTGDGVFIDFDKPGYKVYGKIEFTEEGDEISFNESKYKGIECGYQLSGERGGDVPCRTWEVNGSIPISFLKLDRGELYSRIAKALDGVSRDGIPYHVFNRAVVGITDTVIDEILARVKGLL